MLEVELLDSGLIRSDGSAFDTDLALSDGVSSIDGDLIVSGVSVLNTEVKVFDVEIKEGVDELVLDGLPNDSGHFIAIEFGNWVFDFDFGELHQKRYFIKKMMLFEPNPGLQY